MSDCPIHVSLLKWKLLLTWFTGTFLHIETRINLAIRPIIYYRGKSLHPKLLFLSLELSKVGPESADAHQNAQIKGYEELTAHKKRPRPNIPKCN